MFAVKTSIVPPSIFHILEYILVYSGVTVLLLVLLAFIPLGVFNWLDVADTLLLLLLFYYLTDMSDFGFRFLWLLLVCQWYLIVLVVTILVLEVIRTNTQEIRCSSNSNSIISPLSLLQTYYHISIIIGTIIITVCVCVCVLLCIL